jgi:hypothetical protein
MSDPRRVRGVLLLYHHPAGQSAPTIMEHVRAFGAHSRFPVWAVNTESGFPAGLDGLEFDAIVLHYSLFGIWPYQIGPRFLAYLQHTAASRRIAFFQDEYRYCAERFRFLADFRVDTVYSLLEPDEARRVYGPDTGVGTIEHTLTGFVAEELVETARALALPDERRSIDVGYRARHLPFHMGRGAQEKHFIGAEFARRAQGLGLVLDIDTDERRRILGGDWHRFVAGCRAMLGVEAGVSIFDLDGSAEAACSAALATNPGASFEEIERLVLHRWEGNIPYRTLSPRHFEAAAFRVCQILFEGSYSGVLTPMRHYIPLRKDFSNFDEVIRLFRDRQFRSELTTRAYEDLIASGRFSYARFVAAFDDRLAAAGLEPIRDAREIREVSDRLNAGARLRQLRSRLGAFPVMRRLLRLLRRTPTG